MVQLCVRTWSIKAQTHTDTSYTLSRRDDKWSSGLVLLFSLPIWNVRHHETKQYARYARTIYHSTFMINVHHITSILGSFAFFAVQFGSNGSNTKKTKSVDGDDASKISAVLVASLSLRRFIYSFQRPKRYNCKWKLILNGKLKKKQTASTNTQNTFIATAQIVWVYERKLQRNNFNRKITMQIDNKKTPCYY